MSINYTEKRGIGGLLIPFQIIVYLMLIWDYLYFIIPELFIIKIIIFIDAIFIIYSLILFYKKKKTFPLLMNISLWLFYTSFTLHSLSFAYSQDGILYLYTIILSLLVPLPFPIILVCYLKKSKRIKNTYIR